MPVPGTLTAFAQLVRLPAGFTALSNIVAAQLVAHGGAPPWGVTAVLALASLAIYHAGMVLNDCFDYAEDARDRPARPLPAGRIGRTAAWALGFGLLAAGVVLAATAGSRSLAVAAALAALVVGYDAVLKHTALGPAAMAGCRYGNWLLGLSTVPFAPAALLVALPIGLYIAAVTTLGRQETGTPARAGIALAAVGIIAAATALVLLWAAGILPNVGAAAAAAAAGSWLVWRHLRLWQRPDAAGVRRLMTVLILGVIPLDAVVVLGAGLPLHALGVLALLVPARLLARVVYVT